MAKELKTLSIDKWSGLNTESSGKALQPNELKTAENIRFTSIGEVRTEKYGLYPVNSSISNLPITVVTLNDATKCLGAVKFNGISYGVFSNGTTAKIFKIDTGGEYAEITGIELDPDSIVKFKVYGDLLFFVNGKKASFGAYTNVVLYIMNKSEVFSGIDTTSALEEGINNISVHLERLVVTVSNKMFLSKIYPIGADSDWTVDEYVGGDTAGLIQIDNNTDDEIVAIVNHFKSLAIFRKNSIHYMSGSTILGSSIVNRTNVPIGVYMPLSVSPGDKDIYFVSKSGVKAFNGVSSDTQSTNVDTISSIGIDKKIRTLISSESNLFGMAFRDRYYLCNSVNGEIYVYDENINGWSVLYDYNEIYRFDIMYLDNNELAMGNKYGLFYMEERTGKISSASTVEHEETAGIPAFPATTDMIYTIVNSDNHGLSDGSEIVISGFSDSRLNKAFKVNSSSDAISDPANNFIIEQEMMNNPGFIQTYEDDWVLIGGSAVGSVTIQNNNVYIKCSDSAGGGINTDGDLLESGYIYKIKVVVTSFTDIIGTEGELIVTIPLIGTKSISSAGTYEFFVVGDDVTGTIALFGSSTGGDYSLAEIDSVSVTRSPINDGESFSYGSWTGGWTGAFNDSRKFSIKTADIDFGYRSNYKKIDTIEIDILSIAKKGGAITVNWYTDGSNVAAGSKDFILSDSDMSNGTYTLKLSSNKDGIKEFRSISIEVTGEDVEYLGTTVYAIDEISIQNVNFNYEVLRRTI